MKDAKRKQITSESFDRRLTFNRADMNEETRSVQISISSETPVERYFGSEVLVHTAEAIDMERAGMDQGLALLVEHDREKVVGRVKDIRIEKRRLVGNAVFSDNSKLARRTWKDVRDGFLTDISVRYDILELKEKSNSDTIEVTRWKPTETSIVSIPADSTVGINRSKSKEDSTMDKDKDKSDGDKGVTVASFTAAQEQARTAGIQAGQAAERTRVDGINKVFGLHIHKTGVRELAAECISQGETAARSGELLLEFLAGDPQPAAGSRAQGESSHAPRIEGGKDESEKWVEGVTESLLVRCDLITDKEKRREAAKSEFRGMSLGDIARDYLIRQNAAISGLGRQQIAGQAFTRAGMHGTSDFSAILENVANKSLLIGFDEAPETWNIWASIGNLSDFKPASRVNISSFSDLELVLENDEYKEGHVSDLKEIIQLAKYGKLFHITREAIINDDTSSFSRIPRAMGQAAARTVGDLAYNVLINNPTLNEDAQPVFSAAHNNLGTAGPITETTLDEFGQLMAAQRSPAPADGEEGAVLNYTPEYLIIPKALRMTAMKVTQTPTNPSGNAGALDVNTQANMWTVVSDARLDADSTTQYYGLANQNIADTIEVAFLDGNSEPYMESQNGFSTDGVAYKVRIEAAAAALGFRGATRNAGA